VLPTAALRRLQRLTRCWERTPWCRCIRWSIQLAACVRVHCACACFVVACLCMRICLVPDRVINHKVFCVCVFGPFFLYVLVYFVSGATCWSGQTSTTPSLLCHVVGFCMHARAHTGLRSHVTFFHGKRVEEWYTSDSAHASETNVLVGPDTHLCGITGKLTHDTVLPAPALVYQLVLPCGTVVVHACCVRHSL